MRIKKLSFAVSTAVILAGASCAATLYWNLGAWRSPQPGGRVEREDFKRRPLPGAAIPAKGTRRSSPISPWTELWHLMLLKSGFHCIEASSLEASLQYSADAGEDDLRGALASFASGMPVT